ncbi:MFS transporter [Nocardia sp. SSK8]|uniref:MFS transporter n=1 Tax=Nocardia sp. SSK8 TaxID=3120154 RepID=UPI00300A6BDD
MPQPILLSGAFPAVLACGLGCSGPLSGIMVWGIGFENRTGPAVDAGGGGGSRMVPRARFPALSIGADFRRLWLAQALSSFGEYLFAGTSVVWVATSLFPDSPRLPALVGAVVLAAAVPRIVVGPLAGVYADRWCARRTMIVNDCLRAGLFTLLLGAVQVIRLTEVQIYAAILVCIVVSETSAQFFNPARAAVMHVAIPEDRRVDAASMSMFSLTGVAIIAAAAGPALFGIFGATVAISVCVVMYSASGVMVVRSGDHYQPARVAGNRFWRDFTEGVRATWRTPSLRIVVIGACLYGVSMGINNSVLALFGMKTLDLSAARYGLLAMMFPVGNMVSAVLGPRLIQRIGVDRAYPAALSALGLGYLVYACAGGLVTACVLMLACGVIFSIYIMCQGPIVQAAVPEGYMGRISAVLGPVVSIAAAVSTLCASQALSFAGARGVVVGEGGWDDPYRLLIMSGAAFLLIGGGGMAYAQARRDTVRGVADGVTSTGRA